MDSRFAMEERDAGPLVRAGTSHPAPRGLVRRAGAATLQLLERALPHARWADRAVFQLRFLRELGRLPLPVTDPRASYNDFLLDRMLREDWDTLERVCIDKEHAKLFATAMCPGLEVAPTRAVFDLSCATAAARLADALKARSGHAEIAKPTHGSGSLLFLRQRPCAERIRAFVDAATGDFWRAARESQYRGLSRKVVIEDDLSCAGVPPSDYKFFCSRGEILFCEVVTGRFVDYRRYVVTADFAHSAASGSAKAAPGLPPLPPNLAELQQAAQRLSQPFRFVRVDLYSVGGRAYFGELTFVPHAATGRLVSEDFGRWVMARIRANAAAAEISSGTADQGMAQGDLLAMP